MLPGKDKVIATCINCNASYELESVDEMQVLWTAKVHKIRCLNEECDKVNFIWENHLKEGYSWKCSKCQSKHDVVLGISYTAELTEETASG